MILTQLKHPLTLAALCFLVVVGTLIRVQEYRLPLYAARITAPVREQLAQRDQAFSQPSEPDETHPAHLYKQAMDMLRAGDDPSLQLLQADWTLDETPRLEYRKLCIPLPTQPFPEALQTEMEAVPKAHQEALALLHRAALLPAKPWDLVADGAGSFENWPWCREIANVLFLDALAHILQRDESGVLRAMEGLTAFFRAQELVSPFLPSGLSFFIYNRSKLYILLAYGLETSLFSTETLNKLDSLLVYSGKPGERALLRAFDENDYYIQNDAQAHRAGGSLNAGVYWYVDRFSMRAGMKELMRRKELFALMSGFTDNKFLNAQTRFTMHKLFHMSTLFEMVYSWTDPYARTSPVDSATLCIPDRWQLERIMANEVNTAVTLATARAAIALEKYRRDTGAFPETISKLFPNYLPDAVSKYFGPSMLKYARTVTGWQIAFNGQKELTLPASIINRAYMGLF